MDIYSRAPEVSCFVTCVVTLQCIPLNICLFYGDNHDVGMKRISTQCQILNSALFWCSSKHARTWGRVVCRFIKDTLFHIDFTTHVDRIQVEFLLQKRPNSSFAGVFLETKTLISSYHCLALSHGCRLLTMCVLPSFLLENFFFFCSFVNQTCFPFAATKWKM